MPVSRSPLVAVVLDGLLGPLELSLAGLVVEEGALGVLHPGGVFSTRERLSMPSRTRMIAVGSGTWAQDFESS